jgi:predicted outer membrane repeat protein
VRSWTGLNKTIPTGGSVTIALDAAFDCGDYGSQITIPAGVNVTIHGNGAVLDAAQKGRFFLVNGNLVLNHLVLRNGSVIRLLCCSSEPHAPCNSSRIAPLKNCGYCGEYCGRHGWYGGAIYVNGGATCNIDGGTFLSNTATTGGAIFIHSDATCNIDGGAFVSNTAEGSGDVDGDMLGGAIHNKGTLSVNLANFTLNKVTNHYLDSFGGAITNQGNLTVKLAIFTSNSAATGGGAIHNGGTLTVTYANFTSNSVTNETEYKSEIVGGGAIYNYGTLTIEYASFTGNSAVSGAYGEFYGGGAVLNSGTLTVKYANFISNSVDAYPGGGAIANGRFEQSATLTVAYANFTSNSAHTPSWSYGGGGAICIGFGATCNIDGGNFLSNTATNGGAIYIDGGATCNIDGASFLFNFGGEGGALYAHLSTVTISSAVFGGDSPDDVKNDGSTVNFIACNGSNIIPMKNGDIIPELPTTCPTPAPTAGASEGIVVAVAAAGCIAAIAMAAAACHFAKERRRKRGLAGEGWKEPLLHNQQHDTNSAELQHSGDVDTGGDGSGQEPAEPVEPAEYDADTGAPINTEANTEA